MKVVLRHLQGPHHKNISWMKQKWRCLIFAFYPKWDKNDLKRVSLTLKVCNWLSYKVTLGIDNVRLTNSFGMKLYHILKMKKSATHAAQPSMAPCVILSTHKILLWHVCTHHSPCQHDRYATCPRLHEVHHQITNTSKYPNKTSTLNRNFVRKN